MEEYTKLPCSQIGKLNTVKMSVLSKLIDSTPFSKICRNKQADSEIYMEMLSAKNCPILKNKVETLYPHISGLILTLH